MKNKKFYRRLLCIAMCAMMFVAECSAVTVKKFSWGSTYYVGASEIAEFRANIQHIADEIDTSNRVLAAATDFCNIDYKIMSGESKLIESTSLDKLIEALGNWERKSKPIVVSIPDVIEGWIIEEQ